MIAAWVRSPPLRNQTPSKPDGSRPHPTSFAIRTGPCTRSRTRQWRFSAVREFSAFVPPMIGDGDTFRQRHVDGASADGSAIQSDLVVGDRFPRWSIPIARDSDRTGDRDGTLAIDGDIDAGW